MKNNMTLMDNFKGLSRMVYSFEAKRKFRRLLKETHPDLIYILYYQNKISCSIVDAARELDIPVIQRISDYSLLAPCGILYNQKTNRICEDCLKSGLLKSIKNRCVLNSTIYSTVKAASILVQNSLGMKDKIQKFIFPSTFTLNKFVEAGYNRSKLIHIPTLFNDSVIRKDLDIEYQPYALFIGRIDPDKGLQTLVDAFVETNYSLKIIGFSSVDGYQEKLKSYISNKTHNIEFLGRMNFDQMQNYLSKCLFTIIPSEWYDNLPNTLLESYAFKKCVIATNVGSLTENVEDGETGLLFEYKNVSDLKTKAKYLFNNPNRAKEMGVNARKLIDTKFSIKKHMESLLNIFEDVYAKKNS